MAGDEVSCHAVLTRNANSQRLIVSKTAFALGRRIRRTGYPEAVQQLKLQAQKLLGLPDDVTISVSELSCREPGCPDVETVVAILREGEKPTIARVHKPIPDVTSQELKAAFELALGPKRPGEP
ncbi:hypothetical protein [Bradyrhizobium commune]|uniref:Nitrate reductase n=1 Tax=Bradyrhizobium commune TaxID=83627 RepID=A0A7S9D3T2_9BRAD|nr:hypothetical protein [Bradyrhizobium commune]QPF90636.1 hypothetical protein IC761_29740 [Bradyrhizobium commune]